MSILSQTIIFKAILFFTSDLSLSLLFLDTLSLLSLDSLLF